MDAPVESLPKVQLNRMQTLRLIAVGIANWGTLTGALCFAVAGAAQFREPPP